MCAFIVKHQVSLLYRLVFKTFSLSLSLGPRQFCNCLNWPLFHCLPNIDDHRFRFIVHFRWLSSPSWEESKNNFFFGLFSFSFVHCCFCLRRLFLGLTYFDLFFGFASNIFWCSFRFFFASMKIVCDWKREQCLQSHENLERTTNLL